MFSFTDDTLYDVNIPGTKSDGDTTFDWSAEPAVDAGQVNIYIDMQKNKNQLICPKKYMYK